MNVKKKLKWVGSFVRMCLCFVCGLLVIYLSSGFGITFFSSISLLAALFFSAVSVLLVWARDTGNVAILSPLSTSTVDIFESGPPIFEIHAQNCSFVFLLFFFNCLVFPFTWLLAFSQWKIVYFGVFLNGFCLSTCFNAFSLSLYLQKPIYSMKPFLYIREASSSFSINPHLLIRFYSIIIMWILLCADHKTPFNKRMC